MKSTYSDNALRRRSSEGNDVHIDEEEREYDKRSPFAKDRDRLIYSSAFRRMAGKSQVVASTEIGPFHNRLTHSLKVAQLGRRLAERFRHEHNDESAPEGKILAPDPDLVEFACLAHDIGHPPFGHAGEVELCDTVDRLMAKAVQGGQERQEQIDKCRVELGGFEGNAQSFRIVTRLSHKWLSDDGRDTSDDSRDTSSIHPRSWFGLDLTAASMDAMSKYPWGREHVRRRKWGVYGPDKTNPLTEDKLLRSSDFLALRWARQCTEAPSASEERKSFECQLMDWCDDVTYAVHDVEDFFMIGMIPLDRIFSDYIDLSHVTRKDLPRATDETAETDQSQWVPPNPPEWGEFKDYVIEKWQRQHSEESDLRPIEPTDTYLNNLRLGLIRTCSGLKVWEHGRDSTLGRRASHVRANALIEYFIRDLGVDGKPMLHEGDLLLAGRDVMDKTTGEKRAQTLEDQCDLLKELIWMYVIELPGLTTQRAGQQRIISDLVETFAADDSLLPTHYRDLIKSDGSGYSDAEGSYVAECTKIRVAADYVASLTEPHAIALHKRLTGAELGGFRDSI